VGGGGATSASTKLRGRSRASELVVTEARAAFDWDIALHGWSYRGVHASWLSTPGRRPNQQEWRRWFWHTPIRPKRSRHLRVGPRCRSTLRQDATLAAAQPPRTPPRGWTTTHTQLDPPPGPGYAGPGYAPGLVTHLDLDLPPPVYSRGTCSSSLAVTLGRDTRAHAINQPLDIIPGGTRPFD
jgi:hypothetical protein